MHIITIPFPLAPERPALHTAILLAIAADAADEHANVSCISIDTLTLLASEMLQQDFEDADIERALAELIEAGAVAHEMDGMVAYDVPVQVRLQRSADEADWAEYRYLGDVIERRTADATGWVPLDDLRLALLLLFDEEAGTALRAWHVHHRLRKLRR